MENEPGAPRPNHRVKYIAAIAVSIAVAIAAVVVVRRLLVLRSR
ncbi:MULTISPECIES: hypothetical protein [unclassified Mycolicibacterium]|nr:MULTISPECIES: hypothetical protein [unclassified Mycolicibacterium]